MSKRRLSILDVGAGLGLQSIISAKLGHDVVAIDRGECQIRHMMRNARRNSVESRVSVFKADLRKYETWAPRITHNRTRLFDVIIAVGMQYLPFDVHETL